MGTNRAQCPCSIMKTYDSFSRKKGYTFSFEWDFLFQKEDFYQLGWCLCIGSTFWLCSLIMKNGSFMVDVCRLCVLLRMHRVGCLYEQMGLRTQFTLQSSSLYLFCRTAGATIHLSFRCATQKYTGVQGQPIAFNLDILAVCGILVICKKRVEYV